MLYIHNKKPLDSYCYDVTWHVGEVKPRFNKEDTDFVVQADDDELLYIIGEFSNIPYTKGKVQRWFGEMAKFIVMNL